jgi:transposase
MPRVRKLEAYKSIVLEAYANGASIKGLASTYAVSPGTIKNILKRANVTIRPQGRPRKEK